MKIIGRRSVLGVNYGAANQRGMEVDRGRSRTVAEKASARLKPEGSSEFSQQAIPWKEVKQEKKFVLDVLEATEILASYLKARERGEESVELLRKFLGELKRVLTVEGEGARLQFKEVATGHNKDRERFLKLERNNRMHVVPGNFEVICQPALTRIYAERKRSAYSRNRRIFD